MKTFNQFLNERVATGPRLGEPRSKGATHANAGEGQKIQKRTKKWMDKKGMKGAPGLDAMKAREAEHRARRGVREDAALDFVKKKIEREHGKGAYVSKDNPRKPQSAADKAKARAHQAKVDKENAAERAKDPSQGRYPRG